MKVNMKNFLIGGLAIGQEKVDALTLDTAIPKCCCYLLRNAKHLSAGFCVQISQICGVAIGDDQNMTCIDRLNVHKRGAMFVSINDAGR